MTCPNCGDAFEELDPRLFSFNSPHGWCPICNGFGYILPFAIEDENAESKLAAELIAERRSDSVDVESVEQCPECQGTRLNDIARAVQVQGYTIDQITATSIKHAIPLIESLKFSGTNRTIAADIVTEIKQRLSFMQQVGLEYLTLARSAKTLSGGESQRIRLAAQLGSNLRGVLYVLDEPTIGLHPRDNERLLDTLKALKEKGNTLVVVEHDEETMRRADLIVDLGPGAGRGGGNLVFLGPMKEILKCRDSVTARYLARPIAHPVRGSWRPLHDANWLEIQGAHVNNLKNIDVRFPVGRLSVITGVSGSGKSTILRSVLLPAVRATPAENKKESRIGNRCLERGGWLRTSGFRSSKWINRPLAKRRVRSRRPTSKYSTIYVPCLRSFRNPGSAVTTPAVSRSTRRVAAARFAPVRESSNWK